MTAELTVMCGGRPEPPPPALIVYKASISVTLEHSSVHTNPDFDGEALYRRLIVRPPFGKLDEWPPELANDVSADFLLLGLAHLKNLFGLTALLPEASPDRMRQAAYDRFLTTDPSDLGDLSRYRRVLVEAGIYENLNAYWERTYENGILPPGLTGELVNASESDLDVYVKNLIRADLIDRIATLRNP